MTTTRPKMVDTATSNTDCSARLIHRNEQLCSAYRFHYFYSDK